MITASHNPIDDNGWKYATGVDSLGGDPAPPGALLSAPDMGSLIRAANAFKPAPTQAGVNPEPDQHARERAAKMQCRGIVFVCDGYKPVVNQWMLTVPQFFVVEFFYCLHIVKS